MKTEVEIREFTRGWGNKIDEIREFNSIKEAEDFVQTFNSKNDLKYVPDWYLRAEIAD